MTGSVEVTDGDMFASGADVLVVPTNCFGVQGKGLAKVFAKRWPTWSTAYHAHCQRTEMRPGDVHWYNISATDRRFVLAVTTKRDWRHASQIEWIRTGARNVADEVCKSDATSIGLPAIGCGLGECAWEDVRSILVEAGERMAEAGVRVTIYAPHEAPKRSR